MLDHRPNLSAVGSTPLTLTNKAEHIRHISPTLIEEPAESVISYIAGPTEAHITTAAAIAVTEFLLLGVAT
jgi:hypothetical protein